MEEKLPETREPTEGIAIVEDIFAQPGIDTAEGRMGLLLQGEAMQSHYIDMEPGLYLDEHAHETESIIVTLRGEWVLCSRGERHHMTEGDAFWFGPGVPTGYEVPPSFEESAYILIFKGELLNESPDAFVEYLTEEMPEIVAEHRENGAAFTFDELDEDHPAKEFARTLAE